MGMWIPDWFQAGISTKKGEMELMSRKNKMSSEKS